MTKTEPAAFDEGLDAYDAGHWVQAAVCFRQALEDGCDPIKGWTNLAAALRASGHEAAAAAAASRAIAADPNSPEAWSVRGNARMKLGDHDNGIADLRRATTLDDAEASFHNCLGFAYLNASRPAEALLAFQAARARAPEVALYHFNEGQAFLQLGRYAEGWVGYERRFDAGLLDHRGFDAPLWDGGPTGGPVLLQAEQGHGDAIQFARFLPDALVRAPNAVVEVLPPLRRLFAASFPGVRVIAIGDGVPAHDQRLPFASLPAVLDSPPVGMSEPYLRPPDGVTPPPLAADAQFKIGLTWRGKANPWDRSCPLRSLLSLAEVPDVKLFSLQRGGSREIADEGAEAFVEDLTLRLSDFADDAAVLAELDLIISIDTAIAHLAGAMARPVWLLATFASDWRFQPGRTDSDWYPSTRIFRQHNPGDWSGAVKELREALVQLIGGKA